LKAGRGLQDFLRNFALKSTDVFELLPVAGTLYSVLKSVFSLHPGL
jgi:hypothetical protein